MTMHDVICILCLISDICFAYAYFRSLVAEEKHIKAINLSYRDAIEKAIFMDAYMTSTYRNDPRVNDLHMQLKSAFNQLPVSSQIPYE